MTVSREPRTRLHITRRAFLAVSAVSALALATVRRPFAKAQTPPPPGINDETVSEKTVPTSCLNCATRCGTVVRVANGRAVHIKGNPLSRVSEGELCPRGLIGLQVLYDENRITGPVRRTNPNKGKGMVPGWTPVSWDQALSEVGSRLRALRQTGRPNRLAIFQGLNAVSDEDILKRFASAYGTPNLITTESFEKASEITGRWMADGGEGHIAYDIEKTNYILAFGAGILESEKPVTRNLRMWGKIRRERPNRARVVVIDPRYSVTAARADRWLAITPGTDAALAMAIANVIITEGLQDARFIDDQTAGFDDYRQLALAQYSPESVASITGIDASTIREIAREFAQARPAIAWVGRGAAAWPGGSYASYAIYCLNALVGSIDVPGGIIYQKEPPYREMTEIEPDDIAAAGLAEASLGMNGASLPTARGASANRIADSLVEGNPYPAEIAIGVNSNFNMLAPGNERWNRAMAGLAYYVHVGSSFNEMSEYADLILPTPTFMEQWAYDHSPPGAGFPEVRLKQPVIGPWHDVKNLGDIIFKLAADLGGSVETAFSGLGGGARGFVEYRTGPLMVWDEFVAKGVWTGPPYEYGGTSSPFKTPSGKFELRSGNLEAELKSRGAAATGAAALLPHFETPDFAGDASNYPLMLSVYQPLLNIENGSQNYPWAQDPYLVMHGMGWTTFAEMNRVTAEGLGIRDGDPVWVESQSGRLRLPARVTEGIRPGVVSIATGQGHYAGGKWQKGIGVNPNDIIGVSYDALSGQSAFFNTRVRVFRA